MPTKHQIPPEVMDVLRRSTVTDDRVTLPPGQLARDLYQKVNKVLADAGGKWNKSAGAHLFPHDPRPALGLALVTGVSVDEQQLFQAFYTPPNLAARMAEKAQVAGKIVLEPSAGKGALVLAALAAGATFVHAVELDERRRDDLVGQGRGVSIQDFLEMPPPPPGTKRSRPPMVDRILMNPPFTKGQDVKHVAHAIKFLRPGGRLVAIMSPMAHSHKLFTTHIQPYVTELLTLPAGTFKDSGTNVATLLVTLDLPGPSS